MRSRIPFLLMIFLTGAASFGAEQTGFAFLRLPAAAQGAATMSVFSQVNASSSSLFENPAGLHGSGLQVALSHILWFSDVRSEVLTVSYPIGKWNIGAGANLISIPGIEIRTRPTSEPDGTTEGQYLTTALGASYRPFKKLTLGFSGKYFQEHLYTTQTTGWAFDVGGRWLAPSDLDLSFLISNIGIGRDLNAQEGPLPTTLKIGIIRPEIFTEGPVNVSVGLNLVALIPTQRTYMQAGIEMHFTDYVKLRAGFERVGVINRTALGLGIRWGMVGLDYAFLFMPEGLGYPQLFTLNFYPHPKK